MREAFVTARGAARMLGLGRETTNRILAAGLAGDPILAGSAHLYDGERVEALRSRPVLDDATTLPPACADGVLIARVDPRTAADGSGPWRLAPGRLAVLAVLLGQNGSVPLVTTVGGFVTHVAEVTGYSGAPPDGRQVLLRTTEATEETEGTNWHHAFEGHVLRTPPGSPLWFWRCRWAPQGRRRETTWQTTLPKRTLPKTTLPKTTLLRTTPARPPAAAG